MKEHTHTHYGESWAVSSNPAGGEIFNLLAKIKKKDQLLKSPSVGKHNSTRGDEGKKELKSSRDMKCEARTVVGRGGAEPAM